ncbi:Retrotransposon-derived protein PEG10 [Labeo rohita]|uniref:Retrotransposon-derived protein PEG10 n=1 Tax=Labeo rohita TaxID=84645 RepID=A0ABQ8LIT9_LABRO|nr:Retrotransposon-derived protein PEG10 [Labeo rohita]
MLLECVCVGVAVTVIVLQLVLVGVCYLMPVFSVLCCQIVVIRLCVRIVFQLLCSLLPHWDLFLFAPLLWIIFPGGSAAHSRPCATRSFHQNMHMSPSVVLIVNSRKRNPVLFDMTERSDHTMDSASAPTVQELLSLNNARMDQQEEHLLNTGRAVQALVAQVSELTLQLQQLRSPTAPPTPPSPPQLTNTEHLPEPRLPTPEPYAGEPKLCRAFLTKCSMFFSLQPRTFATESSKVALVLTLLSGRAALWGTAVWALSDEMKRVFDRAVVGREAARMLTDLRQGNRMVSDCSIEFCTLAAECRWNEQAQWDVFLHGLADRIQKEIFTLELPADLDGLIDLAHRVDARLQRLDQFCSNTQVSDFSANPVTASTNTVSPAFDQEPMQVGRARLSREERERRRAKGLCLYCGATGHFLANCLVKGTARQ